jgi:hypothetical protein
VSALPLPDGISAFLRSSPVAALGALMVIATAHKEIFDWADQDYLLRRA